jgi:hypothetical protein
MQGCEGQGAEARKAVEGGGDDGGAVLAPCGAREVEVGESKLREGGRHVEQAHTHERIVAQIEPFQMMGAQKELPQGDCGKGADPGGSQVSKSAPQCID